MDAKLDCDVDVEGAADMMDRGEGGDSRWWWTTRRRHRYILVAHPTLRPSEPMSHGAKLNERPGL